MLCTNVEGWVPKLSFTPRSDTSFQGLGLGLTNVVLFHVTSFWGLSAKTGHQLSTATRHTLKTEFWNTMAWYFEYFSRSTFESPNTKLVSEFQINKDRWSHRIYDCKQCGYLTYLVVNSWEESRAKILGDTHQLMYQCGVLLNFLLVEPLQSLHLFWPLISGSKSDCWLGRGQHASTDISVWSFSQRFVGRTTPISALIMTVDFRLRIRRLMELWKTSTLHQTSGTANLLLSFSKCRGPPIEINQDCLAQILTIIRQQVQPSELIIVIWSIR